MHKIKKNKLLVPIVLKNNQKLKMRISEYRTNKQTQRQKQIYKAYQNYSPLLSNRNQKKQSQHKHSHQNNSNTQHLKNIRNHRYLKRNPVIEHEQKINLQLLLHLNNNILKKNHQSMIEIPQRSSFIINKGKKSVQKKSTHIMEHSSFDMFKSKQKRMKDYVPPLNNFQNPKAYILKQNGKKLFNLGKLKQAQKCFTDSIVQNPQLLESHYFLSIIYISQKKFNEAIHTLNRIITQKSDYKKSVYLFLSIALKNVNQIQQAIFICSQGITIFPKYNDLIIYRAKLYIIDKILDLALVDLNTALMIDAKNTEIYLIKSQCLCLLKDFQQALEVLSVSLQLNQIQKIKFMHQKVYCYRQLNRIPEAKKQIQKLLIADLNSSQTYLQKGYIQIKQKLFNQALLSFEQCIKKNTSLKAQTQALIQITKVKIINRDFYNAYYQISRAQYLDLDSPQIKLYKYFTEAIILLMKKKSLQAIQIFDKIMVISQLDEFLTKIFYLYRAYGYFIINQYQKSLYDYIYAQKYIKKDKYNIYNMYLVQGIIKSKNKQFEQAFQFYDKASQLLPNKVQPYLYRCVNYIEMLDSKIIQQENNKQKIQMAFSQLNQAYQISDSNSNLLYLRCLLYLYQGKYIQALQDIKKAISKSEDNVPKYFFYRALTYGSMQNYKQSYKDFSICINLDENYEQAYLQRGKCLFLQNQISKAFEDIKKYVQLRPKQNIYLLQGNLFLMNGNIQQAILRYDISIQTRQILRMKIKCLIMLGEIKKGNTTLKKLKKTITPQHIILDQAILSLLSKIQQQNKQGDYTQIQNTLQKIQKNNTHNQIFQWKHLVFYKAVCKFYLKKYQQSIKYFQSCLEQSLQQQQWIHKINYNIFLCYLKLNSIQKAYQLFIRDILIAKLYNNNSLDLKKLNKLLFNQIKIDHSVQLQQQVEEQAEIYIDLFQNNHINKIVRPFSIQFKHFKFITKICLIQPSYKSKFMYPIVNKNTILPKIKLCEVQNRPQPPWVKRNNQQNLIFTNEINSRQNIDFQTLQIEQQQQQQQQQDEDRNGQQQQQQQYEQGYEQQNKKIDFNKMKQAMKLDDEIQRKLNKILKKKSAK